MPIDSAQDSEQFCRSFNSAASSAIAVWPEHALLLRQLLETQLAAFSKQVDIQGAEVILRLAPAIKFATLINELAVNAAKYGALSVSRGRVSLHWSIDEQSDPPALLFRWEETGGSSVGLPRRTGIGRTDIEAMARDLGKTRVDYGPGGLKCDVQMPLDEVGFYKQRMRQLTESV